MYISSFEIMMKITVYGLMLGNLREEEDGEKREENEKFL